MPSSTFLTVKTSIILSLGDKNRSTRYVTFQGIEEKDGRQKVCHTFLQTVSIRVRQHHHLAKLHAPLASDLQKKYDTPFAYPELTRRLLHNEAPSRPIWKYIGDASIGKESSCLLMPHFYLYLLKSLLEPMTSPQITACLLAAPQYTKPDMVSRFALSAQVHPIYP